MTAKVAAGLSRSLLLLSTNAAASGKPANATEAQIASLLLPRLVAFATTPSEIEGTQEARATISNALVAFVLALPDDRARAAAAGVVVPTLLRRARAEGEVVWPQTSARLLELARRDSEMFKGILTAMDSEERALLEEILRSGGVSAREQSSEREKEEEKPTIALKMDF